MRPRVILLLERILRKVLRELFFRSPKNQGYDFLKAKHEWQRIPVAEIGYLESDALLRESDETLRQLFETAASKRYDPKGWRNYQNGLWEASGIQEIKGKHVFDFGCGFGIDSFQFAKNQNTLSIADIVPSNVELTARVLKLYGYDPRQNIGVTDTYPFFETREKFDLFFSNGVLHHTPKIREILLRAVECLKPEGEIRLMLYSDIGWKIATGSEIPDAKQPVMENPHFCQFVRFFDSVGNYADWYNEERLNLRIGDFLEIKKISYFTKDRRFLFAVLKPRKKS
ncbi:MAG: hypothetical protein A2Z83_08730 [Omnitrophica bacterium GWA2_52_8]|nr:MAG: hypothetical protein A2Z83_08730 [Omnitrophica bacterium GWA2_52_8]